MKKHLFLPILFLFTFYAVGQEQSQVQSAYIYHFTKYMEWPAAKQSGDFVIGVIGVIGDSPITPYLKSLAASKKAGMQSIVIKEFSSVSKVTNCHILFVSSKKSYELSSAIIKGKELSALIITAKAGYGKKGAGINFVTVGGKSRFEINESSIAASNVKVSAKLIQMGIKI
tara:strand:+ start:41 stop:553 length:513 start_codon:yes stop_codon:yes gene_type:complete